MSFHLPADCIICYIFHNAEVVELADALRSGRSVRKGVRVQIPPSAFFQMRSSRRLRQPCDADKTLHIANCSRREM